MVNDEYFSRLGPDEVYWAGLLAAHGSIDIRPQGRPRIQISLACRDDWLLGCLRDAVAPSNNLCVRKTGTTCLSVTSTRMVEDLGRLGIVRLKPERSFPCQLSDYRIGDYLRGVYDGNGGFYRGKRYHRATLTHASNRLLSGLHQRVVRLLGCEVGVLHNLPQHGSNVWQVMRRERLSDLYDLMYSRGGMCLYRKRAKFDECFHMWGGKIFAA